MANGLYTSAELVDTLIVDLNTIPKRLLSGQYIAFCGLINEMGQKLVNLRNGIIADMKNKDDQITNLKEQLRGAGVEVVDYTPQEFIEKMKQEGQELAPGAPGDEMQA